MEHPLRTNRHLIIGRMLAQRTEIIRSSNIRGNLTESGFLSDIKSANNDD